MFLDSFPRDEEQDGRPLRLAREIAGEAGKTRNAWPFPVADKEFVQQHAHQTPLTSVPLTPGPSSFIT